MIVSPYPSLCDIMSGSMIQRETQKEFVELGESLVHSDFSHVSVCMYAD